MTRRALRALHPGDVILDCMGKPLMRVIRVEPARQKSYVVVTCTALVDHPGGEMARAGETCRTSGHGQREVSIR